MPGGSAHGREPEPLEEILDCLAYVRAVEGGDEDGPRLRSMSCICLAGRSDAMVAPLRLACPIANDAGQLGCDAAVVLAGVRDPVLAGHGRHDG